ncbi:MAG TPA: alpha/beta hydrolase [Kofleriaceae bacterium]|nr:alpha/beta hydrolase [Kofleriaceae bacterium]
MLAYESHGTGEPIVFIHGSLMASTFATLVAEPPLAGYRRITYDRRGYGRSPRVDRGMTFAEHAADCAALLHHLGIERAHVVGHSFGGSIALQLALDAPSLVATLSVLEPGLFVGTTAESYRAAIAENHRRYREAGAAVVVDEFLRPRFGEGWRDRLDPTLTAEALENAGFCFEHELPAAAPVGEVDLARIHQPVLAVLGDASDALWARFGETYRVLLRAVPDVRGFILPRATHALQLDNPTDFAAALGDFLTRHPIAR